VYKALCTSFVENAKLGACLLTASLERVDYSLSEHGHLHFVGQ